MAVALSPDQEVATKAFIDALSESGAACVSRATAIKFLFARKFDVARAHALWKQHEATRRREGLNKFEPFEDPLKSELETGKFTILPTRDATGAAIAIFTANKHFPAQTTHQITLQGVVYQLDVALQSVDTQRAGLVFIYDMTDSKYTNFDYELSQKILTMLKGAYPAKLKKVLIVTAPLWFKAPFRILRLFVREKLRERVHTVSAPQLSVHVPRASLPTQLSGLLVVDHAAWLEHCRNSYTNNLQNTKLDSNIDEYVIDNRIQPIVHNGVVSNGDMSARAASRLSGHGDAIIADYCDRSPLRSNFNGDTNSMKSRNINSGTDEEDLDISTTRTWSPSSLSPALSDEECTGGAGVGAGAGGEGALTPQQLAQRVRALGRAGLIAEYEEIRARPLCGTFHHAKLPANLPKNRYTDVLCYDHSRVVLSRSDPDDPASDYINANFVDGYKMKNAYICTQGPLPKTFTDFWRMVWEQNCVVIVMTTRVAERGRLKCGQYWPATVGTSQTHGDYIVSCESVTSAGDVTATVLKVTQVSCGVSRLVWHGQFGRWADYGVPGADLLAFRDTVTQAQRDYTHKLGSAWAGGGRGPPLVVHCSAGIGRTGTFLTLDICLSRLAAEGVCDIRGTVIAVRSQRAHSIQMPSQYVFAYQATLDYATVNGYLEPGDWSGFDDDDDESE